MKFVTLEFIAFGCFSNVRLHFGENGANFHLVYGNNEAGKSTALRGLTNLLYGIPVRTSDAFQHEGPNLRIRGELMRSDGRRLAVTRRKGYQKTLLGGIDDAVVPESLLADMLGGLSQEAFTNIYRLDHEALVRGGEELREGRGDVAESLFQAGAGLGGLRRVLKELEIEAETIFKPRGQNPLINCAIERYQGARSRSRERSVKPADWAEKQRQLADVTAGVERCEADRRCLQAKQGRVERLQLAWEQAAKLRLLRSEMEALGTVVPLPDSASREREEAERAMREACTRGAEARREVERLEAEIATLHAPEPLVVRAEAITALSQRLGEYRQAMADLPVVRAEETRDCAEADEILRDLRSGWTGPGNDPADLCTIERDRIEELANQHSALAQRSQDAAERALAVLDDLARCQAWFDAQPPAPDPAALRQCLLRVQKEGDFEAVLRQARAKLTELEQAAELEAGRLGRWNGSRAELEKLPLPSVETVERIESDFEKIAEGRRQAERHLAEVQARIHRTDAQIQAVQWGGEVPAERQLEAKRERRDQGWQLVRRAWLGSARDLPGERRFHPEKPLPEAYEEAVAEADAVADRLRWEARRAAQLAQLRGLREEEDKRLRELEAELARRESEKALLTEHWNALWRPAAVQPETPREMRGWLRRYAGVLERLDACRAQSGVVQQLESLQRTRAAELREALATVGERTALPEVSLAALIDHGTRVLSRIEQATAQRAALHQELTRRAAERDRAERAKAQAAEALSGWQERWRDALRAVGLGPELHASQALTVLRRIDAYHQKTKDARSRAMRIAVLESVIARFNQDVADLLSAVAARDLDGLPAEQVATALHASLAEAQRHAERRKVLEAQLTQAGEVVRASQAQLHRAEAELALLMRRAGCSSCDELLVAEQKARQTRHFADESGQLMRALVPLAGGAPLEQWLVELEGVDQDQLAVDHDELAAQIATQEKLLGELQAARGKIQTELEAMDGSGRAAEAAEEAQQTAAEIESLAARYLRLRVACGVLRRQIEIYREENQGPIVRRASDLFPRLTRNSFASLKTGFDEKDRPVLFGVRPSGEAVTVMGMSEGTRDQLYLALRLASLERQLETGEPIPFVVDDILMSFDNDRARDTLRVLVELGAKTQVLFFTHHAHLVELAEKAVPAGLLRVHRLGPCAL
ncbi:MAG: AAA family ATPase [Verrucomicrobia bacterium]|nr:AAA family ATPase [Verrucomicrobiota bacterium]